MSEIFKVEREGHIAWFTLNRPDKRNCMDPDFLMVLPIISRPLTKTQMFGW